MRVENLERIAQLNRLRLLSSSLDRSLLMGDPVRLTPFARPWSHMRVATIRGRKLPSMARQWWQIARSAIQSRLAYQWSPDVMAIAEPEQGRNDCRDNQAGPNQKS